MAKQAKAAVVISDYTGLVLDADPFDIPIGAAQVQENCMSNVPGELVVRPGYREVSFEDVS